MVKTEYELSMEREAAQAAVDNERFKKDLVHAIGGETNDGHILISQKGIFEKKRTGELKLIAPLDDRPSDQTEKVASKFNQLTGHKPQ